jgi:hypothetical protein
VEAVVLHRRGNPDAQCLPVLAPGEDTHQLHAASQCAPQPGEHDRRM